MRPIVLHYYTRIVASFFSIFGCLLPADLWALKQEFQRVAFKRTRLATFEQFPILLRGKK